VLKSLVQKAVEENPDVSLELRHPRLAPIGFFASESFVAELRNTYAQR
jgi:hypothetical protein